MIFAIPAASTAIPVNPNTPAIKETIKKTNTHANIVDPSLK